MNHLFKLTYSYIEYERRPTCGGMDSEPTGRKIERQGTSYIVATTERLALASYPYERVYGNKPLVQCLHRIDRVVTQLGCSNTGLKCFTLRRSPPWERSHIYYIVADNKEQAFSCLPDDEWNQIVEDAPEILVHRVMSISA